MATPQQPPPHARRPVAGACLPCGKRISGEQTIVIQPGPPGVWPAFWTTGNKGTLRSRCASESASTCWGDWRMGCCTTARWGSMSSRERVLDHIEMSRVACSRRKPRLTTPDRWWASTGQRANGARSAVERDRRALRVRRGVGRDGHAAASRKIHGGHESVRHVPSGTPTA